MTESPPTSKPRTWNAGLLAGYAILITVWLIILTGADLAPPLR